MPITVEIPGGTAQILGRDELTARRQRAVEVIGLLAAPVVKKIKDAGAENADDTEAAIAKAALTEAEAEVFFKIQDATVYAHLLSWTLDAPRPETVDAVQDMPSTVLEALRSAVSKATQTDPAESFELTDASLDNPDSPSGSSGN